MALFWHILGLYMYSSIMPASFGAERRRVPESTREHQRILAENTEYSAREY
jgi:hypothetical protein